MGFIVDVVLPLSLAFIMFSLGIGLTADDFVRVASQPRDFIVGAVSQVVLLPVVAFLLVSLWTLPAELALGVMILAAAPGGPTSNLLTAFAKGDVALSISLTAIISPLCVLTLPPIVAFSQARLLGPETAAALSIGGAALRLFLIVAVPVLIGLLLRRFAESWARRFEPVALKISGVIFVVVLLAAIYKEWDKLAVYFAQSGSITLVLVVTMMVLSYLLARVFATGPRQHVAISIECGMQNGVLAIAVATALFGGGLTIVPAVTYGLTMYWPVFILIAVARRRTRLSG
jgi:BASS family bile acid:Na+ symporter